LWVVTHSSNSSLNPNPKNPNRLNLYWSPRLLEKAGITNTATSWEYPKESALLMPTYYFLNLWQDWDIRYDVLFQEEFTESNPRGSYKWTEVMAKNYQYDDPNDEVLKELTGKTVENDDVVLQFTRRNVTLADKKTAAEDGIALLGLSDTYETANVNAQGGCKIRSDIKTKFEAFPRFMKYRIWDRDPNGTILLQAANGNVGFADVPVIRYAEMPLIAAESQIGLGNQAAAAQIINTEIRNARVVKPGHNLSEAQVNASDMTVEWILEERARELCGEWLRWFDLKRTGNLVNYIRQHNPAWDGNDVVDEHNNLWPIPNTFLDKLQNAEEFGQNPGYDPYVRSN
ncbi:MAG: RagB/SusD family nutrient uptake outer membrane protein, partial [Prevotella sp.]|nr:RagB/SusD family nutrient uptake outer membrane protein [Prevotella sp.]